MFVCFSNNCVYFCLFYHCFTCFLFSPKISRPHRATLPAISSITTTGSVCGGGCLIRICFGKFNLHSTLARSFVLFLIWCSFAMFLYFAKRNLYWLDSQAGLSVCLFYFCNFVKCCTLQFGILWGLGM